MVIVGNVPGFPTNHVLTRISLLYHIITFFVILCLVKKMNFFPFLFSILAVFRDFCIVSLSDDIYVLYSRFSEHYNLTRRVGIKWLKPTFFLNFLRPVVLVKIPA